MNSWSAWILIESIEKQPTGFTKCIDICFCRQNSSTPESFEANRHFSQCCKPAGHHVFDEFSNLKKKFFNSIPKKRCRFFPEERKSALIITEQCFENFLTIKARIDFCALVESSLTKAANEVNQLAAVNLFVFRWRLLRWMQKMSENFAFRADSDMQPSYFVEQQFRGRVGDYSDDGN